ncbi:MAG: S9 family peptidase [bacterium]
MKTLFSIAIILLISGGYAVAEVPKIPLKNFFKNPEKAAYKISPDGKTLSFLAPYKKRLNIFVQDVDLKKKPVRISSVTDRDINSYFWKGNETIIYSRDFGGDENYQVFAVNIKAKKTKNLTPFKKVRSGVMDDLEDISDNEILITTNSRLKEVFDVYRININTAEMKLVAKNPGNITDWMTDHDGKIRIASSTDGVNTTIFYRNTETEEFKKLMTTNFKVNFSPIFFTFDNKNIYASTNIGRDKSVIVEYDLENNKEIKTIAENNEVDMSGLHYSKKRKVLLTATYYTWKIDRIFFDKEIKDIFNDLESKLNNVEVNMVSEDKEEKTFIVRTSSDKDLGSFFLYNATTKSIKKLAELSPWLKPKNMAEMKPIEYKSRDGLTIHGYLTLPLGKGQQNLPIIVNPHGGPWVRDNWGFDPEVQFLANRGYAVLQMNYRGSTGYGRKFWEASFKQWGQKMQDDITDGVKWLIDEKIADPKKVAIYGGSYGGYAVLAGLAFSPDVYACGVDYVGVSNLFTFMKTIPPYWKPYLETMYEMVGNPEKDIELLKKASPVFHVDKIKAPLFVAQGAKDPRVNIDESNQIVEALKKRGITVQYLVKKNEGHGFRNEENRFDFYEGMESFLDKCINAKTKNSTKIK